MHKVFEVLGLTFIAAVFGTVAGILIQAALTYYS